VAVAVNRLDSKNCLVPPHLVEGRDPYAYAVTVNQARGRVYWADSFVELVSLLTKKGATYLAEADGATRLAVRAQYALGTQIQLQAFANTHAQIAGGWASLADWEAQVLLGRRTLDEQPHNWPTRHLLDGADLWSAAVPLFTLAGTGHGEHVLLTDSNTLVVIDAFSDESLVRSLASAGYLVLWTAMPENAEKA